MGQLKTKLKIAVVTAGTLAAASAAQAQVDTTAVTAAFADATTAVGAIGAVMLGVIAAGIAIKWVLGFVVN